MQNEGGTYQWLKRLRVKKLIEKTSISTNEHHFLTIYCQNVSGAGSKLTRINEQLTQPLFHVIQDMWFNTSIGDIEIIRNTDFSIYRHDRELKEKRRIERIAQQN